MNLPVLKDFNFFKKKVLVRADLDAPLIEWKVEDDERIKECLPTIKYLLDQKAEVILIGHLGRPEGKVVNEFSLRPVAERLRELLGIELGKLGRSGKLGEFEGFKVSENIILLENLRFDPREEENDLNFAKKLAGLGDFYVNEAFATSHREHASIVGVPRFLPHCAGLHFASEVENLSKVIENPKRPLVFVIGGAKPETKLAYIAKFAQIADTILIGGLLAKRENQKSKIKNQKHSSKLKNIVYADLIESGLDINEESIKKFVEIIKNAGTVVWNGPMGKYEVPEGSEGTRRIGEAVGNCGGFRVVGGGDTIAALKKFNLIDKMDYVSTGGGAMLEYLAKGTLPGIEALQ